MENPNPLQKKMIDCILASVKSERYGTLFTRDEIVFNLCKRDPFFSERDALYDTVDLLIKEDYLVEDEKGYIRPNTIRQVVKNWIDFR